jgi:cell division protein FtsX
MLRYSIRDAFKSVFRNFSLSLASISCISITLIVVALALLTSFNVNKISDEIKSDVTVIVFLNLGVNDEEVNKFEQDLNAISNVEKGWDTKSPTERKQLFIEESGFGESIAEYIDNEDEIFHRSYEIRVKDIEKIDETVKEIEANSLVYRVNYGESMVKKLVDSFDLAKNIAYVVVIILVIVSIFLINNTIKLTIFSRRREISIMRVVGASNFTVKGPFVVEGFIIGILGSIVPILLTIFGYKEFYSRFGKGFVLQDTIELITPTEYLERYPQIQVAQPAISTWGAHGYSEVWLNPGNDYMYKHLHQAGERMVYLARCITSPTEVERKALNQCARELLLAQSSDWPFIVTMNTMVDYAHKRFKDHIGRFNALADMIDKHEINEEYLEDISYKDKIFPNIDYQIYAR